jgi:hypothetical protein
MSNGPLSTSNDGKTLESLLTEGQRNQLAGLLSMVINHGFGDLTISIVKGQVRFFRPQLSIHAFQDEKEES